MLRPYPFSLKETTSQAKLPPRAGLFPWQVTSHSQSRPPLSKRHTLKSNTFWITTTSVIGAVVLHSSCIFQGLLFSYKCIDYHLRILWLYPTTTKQKQLWQCERPNPNIPLHLCFGQHTTLLPDGANTYYLRHLCQSILHVQTRTDRPCAACWIPGPGCMQKLVLQRPEAHGSRTWHQGTSQCHRRDWNNNKAIRSALLLTGVLFA